MLDSITKRKIDAARDILVGKVPVPSSQVEQITIALIYKFMYDMDNESIDLGGNPKYFTGDYARYAWNKLFDPKLSGDGRVLLYQDALVNISKNTDIPTLFRDVFKNAFLPYRDPETLRLFLKCINEFSYDHSETLGDAFEYLLAVLGSQGDAGQFRTPRHIIDFMVELIDPQKEDSILDPACGTAGFLISAYKHIIKTNSSNYDREQDPHTFATHGITLDELVIQNGKRYSGDLLTPDQRVILHRNLKGYDIAFEMVRLSLVNMYLHGFNTPQIFEYDTLTSIERWNEYANVILANPPFMTPKGGIRPHQRFTIQAKRSEVLFVDYMLEHLTNNGKAGIIVPEGIIFQSGNAYKQLRKNLVEDNHLVGVISLPGGVFNPYSGVKTSILWIDKALAKKTDKIIFLKINADGFDLGAQRRPCDANDLPAAFENAQAFKKAVLSGTEYKAPDKDVIVVEKKRLAESGDYNLSGERYLAATMKRSDWPLVFIRDVLRLVNGRAFKPGDWNPKESGGLPIIRIQNLNSQKAEFNYYIGEIDPRYIADTGSLLFSWSGSKGTSFGPHIWDREKGVVNQHIFLVHHDEKYLRKYLYYVLKKSVSEVEGKLHGGVGLVHITKGNFESIQIPLPPLSVQKEVVAELDSYQKIIDGAKQVVDNWKPRIDIDPEWGLHPVQDVSIVNPLKSEVRDLPVDTEVSFVPMNDLGLNTIGFNVFRSKPIGELLTGGYTYFRNDDVIIAKVTPCFENGKAGIAKKLKNGIGFGSSEFYVFRCSDKVMPQWLFYLFTSEAFRLLAVSNMTGTGGLQRVPKRFFMNYQIPIPDMSVQLSIITRIESEQKLVDANRELIKLYEQKIKDRINRLWKS